MAVARVQAYIIKSKLAHFYMDQSTINQIMLLIGTAMAIPFFFNLQVFQLLDLIKDLVGGYEINNLLLVTLMSEMGLLIYSLYLYTHWSFKEEKKVKTVVRDFSIPPEFLVIEEHRPKVPDGKPKSDETDLDVLLRNKNVQAIIEANADPLTFFKHLRPIDEALREESGRAREETKSEVKINDDEIGTGTLHDIIKKAQKGKL